MTPLASYDWSLLIQTEKKFYDVILNPDPKTKSTDAKCRFSMIKLVLEGGSSPISPINRLLMYLTCTQAHSILKDLPNHSQVKIPDMSHKKFKVVMKVAGLELNNLDVELKEINILSKTVGFLVANRLAARGHLEDYLPNQESGDRYLEARYLAGIAARILLVVREGVEQIIKFCKETSEDKMICIEDIDTRNLLQNEFKYLIPARVSSKQPNLKDEIIFRVSSQLMAEAWGSLGFQHMNKEGSETIIKQTIVLISRIPEVNHNILDNKVAFSLI